MNIFKNFFCKRRSNSNHTGNLNTIDPVAGHNDVSTNTIPVGMTDIVESTDSVLDNKETSSVTGLTESCFSKKRLFANQKHESYYNLVRDVFCGESSEKLQKLDDEILIYLKNGNDEIIFSIIDRILENILSESFDFWFKNYKLYEKDKEKLSRSQVYGLFNSPAQKMAENQIEKYEKKYSVELLDCSRILKSQEHADVIKKIIISFIEEKVRIIDKRGLKIRDCDINVVGMPGDFKSKVSVETPNRQIPTPVKVAVWRRDDGRCVICKSREKLEYDHIIPFSRGGSNTERNIQLLCEQCNRSKAAKIQ